MKDILANIKEIRQNKGYGQEYMAEQLGVSQPAYLNWEKGKRDLSYNNLIRIAEVLGCEVIDVITYPDKYINSTAVKYPIDDVLLQLRLKHEKRDQVLSIIFGENNLEILNK